MTWRCNKCRAEYESGVQYGGHDFCMTCYVKVRQDEEVKRRKDEQRRDEIRKKKEEEYAEKLEKESQLRREKMRKEALGSGAYGYGGMAVGRRSESGEGGWSWHNRMMERRDKADEDKQKRQMEEEKIFAQQQAEILAKRKAEMAQPSEEEKKRHYWSVALDKQESAAKAKPSPEKAPAWLETAVSKSSFSVGYLPKKGNKAEPQEERTHGSRGWKLDISEHPALELQASKGLPVSLSVGQKGNLILLAGRSHSEQKLAVELVASLLDSKGRKIDMKLEPGKCGIEPNSEAAFSVKFDLKDDTPRGAMAFSGQLKETAIYVDREGAHSEMLRLECEVKTPMELEYERKSAAFESEGGKLFLALVFENRGESGGILSPKSGVSYGKEGSRLRAVLGEKVKVKGYEKGIRLKFLAEKEAPLDKLTLDISGVDSNGKPYKLQKALAEKKTRA